MLKLYDISKTGIKAIDFVRYIRSCDNKNNIIIIPIFIISFCPRTTDYKYSLLIKFTDTTLLIYESIHTDQKKVLDIDMNYHIFTPPGASLLNGFEKSFANKNIKLKQKLLEEILK